MRDSGIKIVSWIKKHWILSICLLSIFAFVGIPFLIHVLFKIDSGISFFQAEWTAGDVLGYYGSILSFIGTVILGILALYQNSIIKEEADKRANLIEQREHEKNMPVFSIAFTGSFGSASNLSFSITNISENSATDIKLSDISISSSQNKLVWKSRQNYQYDYISANGSVHGQLANPSLNHGEHILSMKMMCTDKYNESHTYSICGPFRVGHNFPKVKIEEVKMS